MILRSEGEGPAERWEVAVPPEAYSEILDLFREAQVDRDPAKWVVVGELEVHLKTGGRIQLDLYATYKDRGAFAIERTYYRGGNDRTVAVTLKKYANRSPKPGS